jgi:hypothetical protein
VAEVILIVVITLRVMPHAFGVRVFLLLCKVNLI